MPFLEEENVLICKFLVPTENSSIFLLSVVGGTAAVLPCLEPFPFGILEPVL